MVHIVNKYMKFQLLLETNIIAIGRQHIGYHIYEVMFLMKLYYSVSNFQHQLFVIHKQTLSRHIVTIVFLYSQTTSPLIVKKVFIHQISVYQCINQHGELFRNNYWKSSHSFLSKFVLLKYILNDCYVVYIHVLIITHLHCDIL